MIGIFVTTMPLFAQKVLIGGLYYNLSDVEFTAEVTYDKFNSEDNYSYLSGDLLIPESVTYNGASYKVTSIGDLAFYYCSGLTGTLTIPESVTEIGVGAFFKCNRLSGELTIPVSVISIGEAAFYRCEGFSGSLTIPNSVTLIGSSAFSGCSGFKGSLTISDSVVSIKESTFQGCTGLTGSLTIPDSVTSIEGFAFSECGGFSGSLIIPDSVTEIGEYAFQSCVGIKDVELCASLSTLGASDGYVFSWCSNIESVTCRSANPPMVLGTENFMQTVLDHANLYVPDKSIEIYRSANVWKEFMHIEETAGSSSDTPNIEVNPDAGIHVLVDGYEVTILNASSGAKIYVSDLKGNLIMEPTEFKFSLDDSGTYVITVNRNSFKIFIH